jgi:phage baseplate assembly protein W
MNLIDLNNLVTKNNAPILVTDKQAIDQIFFNIFRTPIYSRRFRPTFGSDLVYILQESITPLNAMRIKASVVQSIQWHSRITVMSNAIEVTPNLNIFGYEITIPYRYNIAEGQFSAKLVQ